MAPKPITAKIDLKYPIYACDFDPRNHDFLLVGGGGGESRSGVPNKITLLNTSQKTELSEVVDIELTNKEDNVQTLAYSQSTDLWATALAGINSSQADQKVGKNEHLRSFLLEYPPKRKAATEESRTAEEAPTKGHTRQTKALGRTAYFTPSAATEKLTYQRVLRLSKKKGEGNGPRLGVVASGLAPEGEIVVFAADTSRPGKDDVRTRLNLGEKIEAADVDITALEADEKRGDGNFRVAYCTDYDIYCIDVNYTYNRPGGVAPQNIYGTGHDYAFEDQGPPPKFRCLRLLTPTLILVLQNLPKQKGSEVFVMELTGAILARKRLHGKIKSATGLSVAALPYPENYNYVQHAIAIAGADRSITILTLDHPATSPYGRKLAFQQYTFIPNVHDNSIMSLTFSDYMPPLGPYISAPTQYLKLASTSMVNTCVVHTLVLAPYPAPTSKEDKPAYLLNSPSKQTVTQNAFSVLIAIIAIAIGSFFLQAFTEIRGGAPEYLGAKTWLSPAVHDWIARPYMFEDGIKSAWSRSISSEVETASSFLSNVAETPSSVFSGVRSTVTSEASEGVNVVVDAIYPVLDQAKSHASSLASKASSLAASAWSQAGIGASMASSSASEEVSGASSVLSEAASSGSSSLSEGASSLSSKASQGVSKASSAASKRASQGSSKASSASSKVSSSASEKASKGSSYASDVANAISSSASAAASSASSIAATDAGAEPLASSASELASSASSLAFSAASEASSSARDGASSVSNSGSSAASVVSSAATDFIDTAQQKTLGLRALLAQREAGADRQGDGDGVDRPDVNVPHEIVVRHDGDAGALSVETHPPEKVVQREMEVKRWEDLDHAEKASWRKRLHDAGEWTLEEGEAVLKGVLFSGLGNIVGAAMGGG